VVRAQVPVLRLQLARSARRGAGGRIRRRTARRSRVRAARRLGAQGRHVFLGGGTPSLFTAAAIDRLLAGIRARIPLLPDAEITLEANPGTFERHKFAGYFAAGVNRLSLGIQSFDDAQLQALAACTTQTRRAAPRRRRS
jgi:coproporphyrinogen III oxidase-like Fe-S oxidoreductase